MRDGVGPVSYTHLDVYKRQALVSACSATPQTSSAVTSDNSGCVYLRVFGRYRH